MTVNRQDKREADSGLGGGDRNGKDRNHDANWSFGDGAEAPEGHEVQVRRGEHQLNANENEDGVTPAERREQTDAKQRRRDDEESCEYRSHGRMIVSL